VFVQTARNAHESFYGAQAFSRAPGGWEQPPLADAHPGGPALTLARRLAADPAADPASVEAPHDLLWFADLADALAPFHGTESATVQHAQPAPDLDYSTPPSLEPGWPPAGSVPQAAAGVAQLVAFGATPPPRCGSWPELADGVCEDAVIAAAGADAFPIPSEVSTVDKRIIPDTDLAVELGREPRQLADWSGYMGNCIGEPWYAEEARQGHCVLMALRDKDDGRIVANLDVRRRVGGWQIHELCARFNDAVPAPLEKHIKQWVNDLPVPMPPTPEPLLPVPPPRSRGGSARRPAAARLHPDLTSALTAVVQRELTAARAESARRVYAELARGLGRPGQPADFEPDAAVIALKRVGPAQRVELVRAALNAGISASALWRATRVRPLATAVSRLDPAMRDYDRIGALTDGAPLPRTLRALARRPKIVPAHAMDSVARSVRAAMGELVGADALARSVARSPSPELVCALAIATTCAAESIKANVVQVVAKRRIKVPGYPATQLFDEDGPWQAALAGAAELGAPVDLFAEHIAEHGLLIPAALLGRGGWQALWSRAHR